MPQVIASLGRKWDYDVWIYSFYFYLINVTDKSIILMKTSVTVFNLGRPDDAFKTRTPYFDAPFVPRTLFKWFFFFQF